MQIKTTDNGRRHRRALWIDDTEVAHLWVIDYTLRIASAEVRMAGIGGVHTEREHRMKGYMRHLFEDTLDYMQREGYDVSMLFGIPNFYTKFGYATAMPAHRFTIKTRDAEDAQPHAAVYPSRPITAGDMPAIVALYNQSNATRTGTLVRDTATFTAFDKGTDWSVGAETALWEDAGGRLLAYAVWDRARTEVNIAELAAVDPALFPTLLYHFAQQAIEKRCEAVTAYVPPDHAFAEYAQRYGITWTIECPRHGDGMLRIFNQKPLFKKLRTMLADRWTRTHQAEDSITLTIQTDLDATTLAFSAAGCKIVADPASAASRGSSPARLDLSQDKLVQLVMGYRSVSDVVNSADVTLAGAALPLLKALFPKQVAFMWKPDYF